MNLKISESALHSVVWEALSKKHSNITKLFFLQREIIPMHEAPFIVVNAFVTTPDGPMRINEEDLEKHLKEWFSIKYPRRELISVSLKYLKTKGEFIGELRIE